MSPTIRPDAASTLLLPGPAETGALTMEALGGLRDPWIEGQNEMRGDWLLETMRPRMKDSTLEK